MISMLTARTSESEESELALKEIESQIDFSMLKKNSVGIIYCHTDFIESNILNEICSQLPFETVGMTSMASADKHGYSLFDLTLTVLTSDDVQFATAMSSELNNKNYLDEIEKTYRKAQGSNKGAPSLVISYMPHVAGLAGDSLVKALDTVSDGTPIWGSLTTSGDFTYNRVFTIGEGNTNGSTLSLILFYGDVNPKFVCSSIPERNIHRNRAIITKSEGAVLHEINDTPVLEYLSEFGLTINKETITTTPLIIYFDGGERPVTIGFYGIFDNGSILAGCDIPEGTSIAIGSIDAAGIFESAQEGIKMIKERSDRGVTLVLPCVTRYLMLAPTQEKELDLITISLSQQSAPFALGYSGGEVCPIMGDDGKYQNRFHNYTFCACILT